MRQYSSLNMEDDYEFRDFVESIAVTREELAAIASKPEYSIPEIRRYLRDQTTGKGPWAHYWARTMPAK